MGRYTTFGQVIDWMAEPLDLANVTNNRPRIVKNANNARQLLFSMYEDLPLFEDVDECFEVQCFRQKCHDCQDIWHGISLPDYIASIAAAYRNSTSITLSGQWRELRDGLRPDETCQVEAIPIATHFPTERELSDLAPIKIKADCQEDEGRIVRLKYKDSGDEEHTEPIELSLQYRSTTREVKELIAPGGVIFDRGMNGGATIAEENGRILSRYKPHEIVPSYKRYKFHNVCPGDSVWVHGARRFVPLYWDHEVVEMDNRLVFEELARYLRLHNSDSAEYKQAAEGHLLRAKELLLGDKSRDRNKSTESKVKVGPRRPPRRGRLSSNRRAYYPS